MKTPQPGDTVVLAYIGRLDNGALFKEVRREEPFSVIIGNSDLPPTLENAVKQMVAGETMKVRVPPEEGYGPRQKDLLQVIDNPDFLAAINPKPGMIIALKVEKDGVTEKVPATVIEVKEGKVTVDYNHPLAGHHLNFEITLLAIQSAN